MLDPADCGPAFIGLPQDVQAEAYDYPARFFEPRVHELAAPAARRGRARHAAALPARRAATAASSPAAACTTRCAEDELAPLRRGARHARSSRRSPASRACVADHPLLRRPDRRHRLRPRRTALAAEADVVLCVGTRLQDFTTGSWTVFGNDDLTLIGLNAARFDATKHLALPLVADALAGPRRARRAARGLAGDDGWVGSGRRRRRQASRRSSPRRRPPDDERADLRAGHRRGQPARDRRTTTRSPRPAGSPAS